ncbi:hypothetical protein C8E03_11955 [Lachnotalea glycerini]|uniref:Uncharacterized protein n=1 Tax=Lachnotalea glycerini TaxID=1763509 RepID=A0A318EGP3_9FIRM|nr:hypothetical protein [Lachnotalea glycerini]PXV85131.1 hypothetical protein C8E03_11955 [Lachnotalea glycerini]
MNQIEYVSERIVNIAVLEETIESAYLDILNIRNELEKDTPSIDFLEEVSKRLHMNILKAKDFEFRVEQRKVFTENSRQY